MIQYLLLILLLTNTSIDDSMAVAGDLPVVFPSQLPVAAQIICDVLGDEISWRAGVDAFLNNSTNLTNLTQELIIA
jgi:hypothetical protein